LERDSPGNGSFGKEPTLTGVEKSSPSEALDRKRCSPILCDSADRLDIDAAADERQ
jgi:hypothetical protein